MNRRTSKAICTSIRLPRTVCASLPKLSRRRKKWATNISASPTIRESSAIANGLSPKRLSQEIKQIRQLNEKTKGIEILIGTEVDILADGSIDFDNKILAELDFVVASIHSGLASPAKRLPPGR